jgi:hypothetical protein
MMLAKEDFLKDVGLLFVLMVVTSKLDTKVSCSLLLGLMQHIFPIGMGVCEVECTSSWEWFLTT